MSDLTIRCNNVPRDILYWHELTDTERAEFADYLDSDARQSEASFFRYKGVVYDLGEFMHVSDRMFGLDREGANEQPVFRKWDSYASDSYFSGVLVRYVQDYERVIVATYCS